MDVNVLYLVSIHTDDKIFFNAELQQVLSLLDNDVNLDNFNSIFVVNRIDELFKLLKDEVYIFNETPDINSNGISHLTVYFTQKNKIESYLIIRDSVISNYIGKSDMLKSNIRVELYKELVKINDNNRKIESGELNLIFNSTTDFNSSILKNSNLLWKEFIAYKKSAKILLYRDLLDIEDFLRAIIKTKNICDKLVNRNMKDLSKCYDDIEQQGIKLLKHASKIIGIIHGINFYYGDELFSSEVALIKQSLQRSYFRKIYTELENELLLCEPLNLYKISEKNLDGIGRTVMNTLLELGLEYVVV